MCWSESSLNLHFLHDFLQSPWLVSKYCSQHFSSVSARVNLQILARNDVMSSVGGRVRRNYEKRWNILIIEGLSLFTVRKMRQGLFNFDDIFWKCSLWERRNWLDFWKNCYCYCFIYPLDVAVELECEVPFAAELVPLGVTWWRRK